MPRISKHATFSPEDDLSRIASALDCPTCGEHHRGDSAWRVEGGAIRALCVQCVTFLTLHVTAEQARALQGVLRVDHVPRERISESRRAVHDEPTLSAVGASGASQST